MVAKRKPIKKCGANQITAGKTDVDQAIARAVLRPTVQAAFTLRECGRLYGRAELSGLVHALTEQTRASNDGDLTRAQAMLTAQILEATPGAELSPTALKLPQDLPFENWKRIGELLMAMPGAEASIKAAQAAR